MKLFCNRFTGLGEVFFSILSTGGHFVQWSGMILAEGHKRNISVKLF